MPERPQHSEDLTKSTDPAALINYAKWGLMGLGGLVLLSWILKILLNPLMLVLVAAIGSAGYFGYRKLVDTDATSTRQLRDEAASGRTGADSSSTAGRDVERRRAEREADALLAEAVVTGQTPSAAPRAAQQAAREAESRDRRLDELAALKERVAREGRRGR